MNPRPSAWREWYEPAALIRVMAITAETNIDVTGGVERVDDGNSNLYHIGRRVDDGHRIAIQHGDAAAIRVIAIPSSPPSRLEVSATRG